MITTGQEWSQLVRKVEPHNHPFVIMLRGQMAHYEPAHLRTKQNPTLLFHFSIKNNTKEVIRGFL